MFDMSRVDVGFAEACEKWQVESRLFPSKIGGKPAWLDLDNLPNADDLECEFCERPMIFLCQVYAPYEEDDSNFHRTLFVFVCRTSSCGQDKNGNIVKVFRSSLRRANKFYSFLPPIEGPDPDFNLSTWAELCVLCGCKASKHCGKCKETAYCCRDHQVLDWRENHKKNCGCSNMSSGTSKHLFTEYELVIEPEELEDESVDAEEELRKYEVLESEGKTGSLNEIPESDLQAHLAFDQDKIFARFRKRIANNPEQVLRYERGGQPLWIAVNPKPDAIPECEYCGSARQFEFQIMPQMLTVLKEDCLDWGILAVYSCKNSCSDSTVNYRREFVFKQNVSC